MIEGMIGIEIDDEEVVLDPRDAEIVVTLLVEEVVLEKEAADDSSKILKNHSSCVCCWVPRC